MDVTTALFTVAVTVGTLGPVNTSETASVFAQSAAPAAISTSVRQASLVPPSTTRPAALVPMYASFIALQGFDIYSTSKAVSRGAREANALMKPVAGKSAASIAVKAAASAGSIYFVERAWKRNRKGAVILMTALNVATAAVVAHNTRVAKQPQR
jgi:hypothetical protein